MKNLNSPTSMGHERMRVHILRKRGADKNVSFSQLPGGLPGERGLPLGVAGGGGGEAGGVESPGCESGGMLRLRAGNLYICYTYILML